MSFGSRSLDRLVLSYSRALESVARQVRCAVGGQEHGSNQSLRPLLESLPPRVMLSADPAWMDSDPFVGLFGGSAPPTSATPLDWARWEDASGEELLDSDPLPHGTQAYLAVGVTGVSQGTILTASILEADPAPNPDDLVAEGIELNYSADRGYWIGEWTALWSDDGLPVDTRPEYYFQVEGYDGQSGQIDVTMGVDIRFADGHVGAIDPTVETWLVSHGLNDTPGGMQEVSDALAGHDPSWQVLVLDWSGIARDPGGVSWLLSGEPFLDDVGLLAAEQLQALGFTGSNASNLNLLGNSWGAVVSHEIARNMAQPIDRLVALDPAEDMTLWPHNWAYDTDDADFRLNTTWSWAFLTSDLGSRDAAAMAHESFLVDFDEPSWGPAGQEAHVASKGMFSAMLAASDTGAVSSLLSPENMNASRSRPWQLDRYDASDWRQDVGFPFYRGSGPFDGVLRLHKVAEEQWEPVSLEYFDSAGNVRVLPETQTLAQGDWVRALHEADVRVAPSATAEVINDGDYSPAATVGLAGLIVDAPVEVDGRTWMHVAFGPGLFAGWVERSTVGPDRTHDSRALGIDASEADGAIDWSGAAGCGVAFVTLRATEGLNVIDGRYAADLPAAEAAGLVVGAVHAGRPDQNPSPAGPVAEADHFLSVAGADVSEGRLRPVLRLETAGSLTPTELSDWAVAWLQAVETATGVEPVLATTGGLLASHLDSRLGEYSLHLVEPTDNVEPTTPTGPWSFWRFSDAVPLACAAGPVAMSLFDGTPWQLLGQTAPTNDDHAALLPNATPLRVDEPATGRIDAMDDSDIFAIDAQTDRRYTLSLSGPAAAGLDVRVLRQDGSELVISPQGLDVTWQADADEPIYVVLNGSATGDYALDLSRSTPLQAAAGDMLERSFNALADWLDQLDAFDFIGQSLPFTDTQIGAVLDLGGLVRQTFSQPLDNYLAGTTSPTVEEVAQFVDSLDNAGQGFGIDVFVEGADVLHQVWGRELRYDLRLGIDRTQDVSILLGEYASGAGVSMELMGELAFLADLSLSVGIDLTDGAPDEYDVFIEMRSMEASGSVDLPSVDAEAFFGFLGAAVTDGMVNLNASLSGAFQDPDGHPGQRLTLAELGQQDLSQIVTLSAQGNASMVLPVSAHVGGWTSPSGAEIRLTDTDLFDGQAPKIDFIQCEEMMDFRAMSAAGVVAAFDQLGGWLDQLTASAVYDLDARLARGQTLANLVDLREAITQRLVHSLMDDSGSATFFTVQEMLVEVANILGVAAADLGADYEPATGELSFDVSFRHNFLDVEVPLDLNYDLGSLAVLSTGATITAEAWAEMDFRFGFQLLPMTATLTGRTALPADGKLSGDAVFDVSLGDRTATVTVAQDDTNQSRQDLVDDVNAAIALAGLAGEVTAGLDAEGRLTLTRHAFGGAVLSLPAVAEGSPADTDLGLWQSAFSAGSRNELVFIEDARFGGGVVLSADDILALARFGVIDLEVWDGSASGSILVDAAVLDPQTGLPGGRRVLQDLLNGFGGDLSGMVDVAIDGSVHVDLTNITVVDNLLGVLTGNPSIAIDWTDVNDPETLTVELNADLQPVQQLQNTTINTTIGLLKDLREWLSGAEQSGMFARDLPIVNKSVADLLKLSDRLGELIADLEGAPPSTIQELVSRMGAFLGEQVSTSFAGGIITFSVDYQDASTTNTRFDLEASLADLGLPETIARILNTGAGASGDLTVHAQAGAQLEFGLDVSDPAAPTGFVVDTSSAYVGLSLSAADLDFFASLGDILGAYIENGTATLDAGTAAHNDAMLSLSLAENPTGQRLGFSQALAATDLALAGAAQAVLPLYWPTREEYVGDIQFSMDLSDWSSSLTGPDLGQLLDAVDLENNLREFASQWTDIWVLLGELLDGEVLGIELPFIGRQMRDFGNFAHDLRQAGAMAFDSLQDYAIASMQYGMYMAFGPDGLGWLTDRNSNGQVEPTDIVLTHGAEFEWVQFDMDLHKEASVLDSSVDFELGLPGIGLELDGGVNASFGFDLSLGIGFSKETGAYLDTSQADEFSVYFGASLPNFHAQGKLGFLQVDVVDNPDNPSYLGLTTGDGSPGLFTIDLVDPSGDDNRLTIGDLRSGAAIESSFDSEWTASARIDLLMRASFAGSAVLPALETNFVVLWDLTGGDPYVGFWDVRLDLGSFFGDMVGPVLSGIQGFIDPIMPVVETLNSPVPVISTFAGSDYTWFDLAETLGFCESADFLESIAEILILIDSVPVIDDDVYIEIGSFDLVGIDPRQIDSLETVQPNILETHDPRAQVTGQGSDFLNRAESLPGSPMQFPLLSNPMTAFKLLLGQDVEIFTYDLPALELGFQYDWVFPVPAWVGIPLPLFVRLGGGIEAGIDLAFGYDTRGLRIFTDTGQAADVFNGFYLSDTSNPFGTGPDVPEAYIRGYILAGLEVNLLILAAGIEGGIEATVDFDLNDPDSDGKIYADEFLETAKRGFLCTFDVAGSIDAYLELYAMLGFRAFGVDVILWEGEWRIAEVTLLDFTVEKGDCRPDRMEGNDSMATAAYIGTGPGLHISGATINGSTDRDWYSFDILEEDDIEVFATFASGRSNLDIEVYDSEGNLVGLSRSGTSSRESVYIKNAQPGTYHVHVYGDGRIAPYKLGVEPAPSSDTTVYYVNDPNVTDPEVNSYFTYKPGDNNNDGLTPDTPVASIQTILERYDIFPQDVIVVDTGNYPSPSVLIREDDEGASYIGAIGGTTLSGSGTRFRVEDADGQTFHRLNFSGSGTGIFIDGDGLSDTHDNIVSLCTFSTSSAGVEIKAHDENTIRDSSFTGGSYAIKLGAQAATVIHDNNIAGASYGIYATGANALIYGNDIHDNTYGFYGNGLLGPADPTTQAPNRVYGNDTGVYLNGDSQINHNEVFNNTVGVRAKGKESQYDGNSIHGNDTGVVAEDSFGPSRLDPIAPNRVYGNVTGVHVTGDNVEVDHTLIYRNSSVGVLVDDADGARIVNNTIHAPAGVGVRAANGTTNLLLRNNIVWAESGHALYVDRDSQWGFDSDFNNLYATGAGKVAWWQKTFDDLFDWQVEVGQDAHSIGYTTIDPTRDDPHFVNPAEDDYHLQPAVSTSIAAGDPLSDFRHEPQPNGGRINLGAYGNTTEAAVAPDRMLRMVYPEFYVDQVAHVGQLVFWWGFDSQTSDNTLGGSVDIDLYEEGHGKVADIAAVPAADGVAAWTPADLGLTGDITKRYRVHVTSVEHPDLAVISREAFAIVPSGKDYYVDDASDTDDQWTVDAVGDNRNTGRSPLDPKASPIAILRSYDLGAGDVLHVDTGHYNVVQNLLISGQTSLGDDEGMELTGPTDGVGVAVLDRDNPYLNSAPIELNDADYVTIRNLDLSGGYHGLWVRGTSTYTSAQNLNIIGAGNDGVVFQGDASNSVFDGLTIRDSGGYGVFVDGVAGTLRNSIIQDSDAPAGVYLDNGDWTGTVLENNEITGHSTYGVHSDGGRNAIVRNNHIHDNGQYGIFSTTDMVAERNAIHGHSEIGLVFYRGSAIQNAIFDNPIGMDAGQSGFSTVTGNRIYNNSEVGLRIADQSVVSQNVIYSNAVGIETGRVYNHYQGKDIDRFFAGEVRSNLVYANGQMGVRLRNATEHEVSYNNYVYPSLIGNTIHQPQGDAIVATGSCGDLTIRNNILHVLAGQALNIDIAAQDGFTADYNLFSLAEIPEPADTDPPADPVSTGAVGSWHGTVRNTLGDWQSASLQGRHSLTGDPKFVDPTGLDDALGFVSEQDDGRDDDFHPRSTAGRMTGSLAPVFDPGTGRTVFLPEQTVIDDELSPAIDRGDPADSPAGEPIPNGGYVNLGAYGQTAHASRSPLQYVLVTYPAGGEVIPIGRTVDIDWRTHDDIGTVDVELLHEGAAVAILGDDVANDGSMSWTLDDALTPGTGYQIRITRNDGSNVSDVNDDPFAIAERVSVFYVNLVGDPDLTDNEYTQAPGDNANDGLTPQTPMASVAAVLQRYDLGAGDLILVDAGVYEMSNGLTLDARSDGVVIQGAQDGISELRYVGSGEDAVTFDGATGITLRNVTITGGQNGVMFINGAADSVLMGCEIAGSQGTGVKLDTYAGSNNIVEGNFIHDHADEEIWNNADFATIHANRVTDSGPLDPGLQEPGIQSQGDGAIITDNIVWGLLNGMYIYGSGEQDVSGNVVYDNQVGIYISNGGAGLTITANEVYGNDTGILAYQYYSRLSELVIAGNTVHDNNTGVLAESSTVAENTIYRNTAGIVGIGWSHIIANRTFSNDWGIVAGTLDDSSYVRVANNISYANTEGGIKVVNGKLYTSGTPQGTVIINNTVYQPSGAGLRVQDGSTDVTVRNNILYSAAGTAVSVAADSTSNFASDYNLYHTTTGTMFDWAGASFDNIPDWYYTVGQDRNSISADPLWVDADGADDALGFVSTAEEAQDDDFHLKSLFGSYQADQDAFVPQDVHSLAIDAGAPGDDFINEPHPNGGARNLGAYGNTSEASLSAEQGVTILRPGALDTQLVQSDTFAIEWRAFGFTGDVSVEVSGNGIAGDYQLLATVPAETGQQAWTIDPALFPASTQYVVRVASVTNPDLYALSPVFEVAGPTHEYYVNIADDSDLTDNEYTTAPGRPSNTGTRPDSPLDSLLSLLNRWDLRPGDTVYVDTGEYDLLATVVMDADQTGVTIQGPTGAGHRALLDRGGSGEHSVFQITADNVAIDSIAMTGAYDAVDIDSADGVAVRNCDIFENTRYGIHVRQYATNVTVADCELRFNGDTELYSMAKTGVLRGNLLYDRGDDYGIRANRSDLTDVLVEGNTAYGFEIGIYSYGAAKVRDNLVHTSSVGIDVRNGAVAEGNTIRDNNYGMYVGYGYSGSASAIDNIVYNNTLSGIQATSVSTILGNTVFSNQIGIRTVTDRTDFSGTIQGNIVYGNSSEGVLIDDAIDASVIGNTVYQPVGSALHLVDRSEGVIVENNILVSLTDCPFVVDEDASLNLYSDYNLFHTLGAEGLIRYRGESFVDLNRWFERTGYGLHSMNTDPGFVDPDGEDDRLGFISEIVSIPWTVDNSDSDAFTAVGSWQAQGEGLDGGSMTTSTIGDRAIWRLTDLEPGRLYRLAVTLPGSTSGRDYSADYEIWAGGQFLRTVDLSHSSAANDYTDLGMSWEWLDGYYEPVDGDLELHLICSDGRLVVADAVQAYKIGGARATDDDFHLQTLSPAIDAADPDSHYFGEPAPNGARRNLGAYGNTSEATPSRAGRSIQVLTPNGGEKISVGRDMTIQWIGEGLCDPRVVAAVNIGGPKVDNWFAEPALSSASNSSQTTQTFDLSLVPDPAPMEVYQTYRYGYNVGDRSTYSMNLADGDYILRLHIAKPSTTLRDGNIYVNGQLIAENFNPADYTTSAYAVVPVEHAVSVAGGEGLTIEIVNTSRYGLALAAFDVLMPEPGDPIGASANVKVSRDGGQTWETIASGVAMDDAGRGEITWTAAGDPTDNALIRVESVEADGVLDVSDAPFQIAPAGTVFYVNTAGDVDFSDNEYTSAAGDNANHGMSPDRPMASLQAMLLRYSFDPGDVVLVDTGRYEDLIADMGLTGRHAGLTILGPTEPGHVVELHRLWKQSYDNCIHVFDTAVGVTIENLTLRSGYSPIYIEGIGTTVRDCELADGYYSGVTVDRDAEASLLADCDIHANRSYAVMVEAANVTVSGNSIDGNGGYGMYLTDHAGGSVIRSNRITNASTGVVANDPVQMIDNVVSHCGTGIDMDYAAEALGNEVHHNTTGIRSGYRNNHNYSIYHNVISDNIVYANTGAGIDAKRWADVIGNAVYSNTTGIAVGYASTTDRHTHQGSISNNLVFDNDDYGIVILQAMPYSGRWTDVVNNTIWQSIGDALRLQGDCKDVHVMNNILVVETGHAMNIDAASADLFSDWNLFHLAGLEGQALAVRSAGVDYATLPDWQAATGQDADSDQGDPLLVDPDGADNVLGYRFTGLGYDGGADDNLTPSGSSPAIDAANGDIAPAVDIDGFPRQDDPGTTNTGSRAYEAVTLFQQGVPAGGTAKGWTSTYTYYTLDLPQGFSFPYFGRHYSQIYVSPKGFLGFTAGYMTDSSNTVEELLTRQIIAPLWDNLYAVSGQNDIYVDAASDHVTIRWHYQNPDRTDSVNFAVTLTPEGAIRFDYGEGNTGLSPTIGISAGDGERYILLDYTDATTLTNADSVLFAQTGPAGAADIGAYEFRGSSLDQMPPSITGITPSVVWDSGATNQGVTSFTLDLSEPINRIDANAIAAYELRYAGVDGLLDTGDDALLDVAPAYATGALEIELGLLVDSLPDGLHRLTVFGDQDRGLHDLAGLTLDGDGDGFAGGNLVRQFAIDSTAPSVGLTALLTSDATPTLDGQVDDPTALVELVIGGQTYPATNNGDGTWRLNGDAFAAPLPDGGYTVTVRATDPAGNIGEITAVNGLIIDTQAPTVTVTPVTTADSTPDLTGTIDDPAASLVVRVDGLTYEATNHGDGTWSVSGDLLTPLTPATYDIQLLAIDEADNLGTDDTTDELIVAPSEIQLVAWQSLADHGGDQLGLVIPDDGAFSEPRQAGVNGLLVEFNGPIDPATFTPDAVLVMGYFRDGSPVDLSANGVTVLVSPDGATGTILFAESLPDAARYLVRLQGVASLAGIALQGDADRVFTALRGDVYDDHKINSSDVALVRSMRSPSPVSQGNEFALRADVNGDGYVTNADADALQAWAGNDARGIPDPDPMMPLVPGDANVQGCVELVDLAVLAANWNINDGSAVWAQGDFSGDGNVDLVDLAILASHWGEVSVPPMSPPTAAVKTNAILEAEDARITPTTPDTEVAPTLSADDPFDMELVDVISGSEGQ